MIQPDEQSHAACSVSDVSSLGNVLRFSHTAMATLFEVFCVHGNKNYARQAAGAAFGPSGTRADLIMTFAPGISRSCPSVTTLSPA